MNGGKTIGRMEQAYPLIYRDMMQRERETREEECAQLDFLSALGIAV